MVAIIFILLVVLIISPIPIFINYLIAKEFYKTACMKGHDKKRYLWICFFFNIVGYLLVCSLPKLEEVTSNK